MSLRFQLCELLLVRVEQELLQLSERHLGESFQAGSDYFFVVWPKIIQLFVLVTENTRVKVNLVDDCEALDDQGRKIF
jgi:hypothetical protein